ncbi:MAG: hypothetical protein ACYCZY_00755 [Lacisediminihabitans sp.]
MTDDREPIDPGDWLAAQFGSNGEDEKPKTFEKPKKPEQPAESPAARPMPVPPILPEPFPPITSPQATGRLAVEFPDPLFPATEPPTAPSTTALAAGAGFNWGLTPGAPAESSGAADVTEPFRAPAVPEQRSTRAVPEPLTAPFGANWPLVEPVPLDASLEGAPSPEAEPPTVALSWETATPDLSAGESAWPESSAPETEILRGGLAALNRRAARREDAVETGNANGADAGATASLDALFGEHRFRDYVAEPSVPENPFVAKAAPADAAGRVQGEPLPQAQKVLLWIAGSLVALLALVVLFVIGTKVPALTGPAPAVAISSSPTSSPTPTTLPPGPLAPGVYKWDRLLGGECLAPYDSAWAEKFTVVDCAQAHPAQMVFRGVFPMAGATAAPYPGAAALQTQINLLCTAPGVINLAAAGAYSDIQFVASYPATDQQWADGDRSYFCFLTRSSGQPITGSVAVPQAAPTPKPAP